MSLDAVRKDINEIDAQLTELLVRRMQCAERVADIKQREGLPIYHPAREQEILNRVRQQGGAYGSYLYEIYGLLMECSRELQHSRNSDTAAFSATLNTAADALPTCGRGVCFGSEGSFSHLALTTAYPCEQLTFADSFQAVFEAVDSGAADFGFLPVENSSAGSVREVYELLLQYRLFITGAVNMPVRHNLLGLPGAQASDIKTVYSHPQALSQCKAFLDSHGISAVTAASTATAARTVAAQKDKTVGAIGSAYAAKKHGLALLTPDVQSFDRNKTRFILLSRQPVLLPDSNKISLVFSLAHTPGSLQKLLTRFALHGLNLTKLESGAGKNGDFETRFYLDFLGSVRETETLSLLAVLTEELSDFVFLGNYKELEL